MFGTFPALIVADTSVVIDWLGGGGDASFTRRVISGQVAIAPVTLTEVVSWPSTTEAVRRELNAFQFLLLQDGYWERAGLLRQSLIKERRKAGVADTLIAQACLDHDLPLLTRDRDFGAFAELAGLKLA